MESLQLRILEWTSLWVVLKRVRTDRSSQSPYTESLIELKQLYKPDSDNFDNLSCNIPSEQRLLPRLCVEVVFISSVMHLASDAKVLASHQS